MKSMKEGTRKIGKLVKTLKKRRLHQNNSQRKKRLHMNIAETKRKKEVSMRRQKKENMNHVQLLKESLQRKE